MKIVKMNTILLSVITLIYSNNALTADACKEGLLLCDKALNDCSSTVNRQDNVIKLQNLQVEQYNELNALHTKQVGFLERENEYKWIYGVLGLVIGGLLADKLRR